MRVVIRLGVGSILSCGEGRLVLKVAPSRVFSWDLIGASVVCMRSPQFMSTVFR